MKATKRALTILASITLLAGAIGSPLMQPQLPVQCSAEETDVLIKDGFTYEKIVPTDTQKGGVKITGCSLKDAKVIIPESIDGLPVISIANSAFSGSSDITSVTIPDGLLTAEPNAFGGIPYLTEIKTSENCKSFTSVDGILFSKDKTKLVCYPMGKKDEVYNIPEGVKTVQQRAFYECFNLKKIIIPDSVTAVKMGAFASCGIEYIKIPETVTSIESSAFYDCKGLKMIAWPKSITKIEDYTFAYSGLKIVVLPESVTQIGKSVFGEEKAVKNISFFGIKGSYAEKYVEEIRKTQSFDDSTTFIAVSEEELGTVISSQFLIDGDINGDGRITTTDARLVLQHAVGLVEFSADQKSRADVNRDGKITSTDAVKLLRFALGIIDKL